MGFATGRVRGHCPPPPLNLKHNSIMGLAPPPKFLEQQVNIVAPPGGTK